MTNNSRSIRNHGFLVYFSLSSTNNATQTNSVKRRQAKPSISFPFFAAPPCTQYEKSLYWDFNLFGRV